MDTKLTEKEIREIIRDELQDFLRNNKYTFSKPIQILDGRNVQLGVTTGTDFGNCLHLNQDKLGFFAKTPTTQQAHIADPSGGTIIDIQARSATSAILLELENLGLFASS